MIYPNDPRITKLSVKGRDQAIKEDERHDLHGRLVMDATDASPAWLRLVNEYIIPTITSASTREQLLRDIGWPLPSNAIVDRISDASSAVFGAQDRLISIRTTDEKIQQDAEAYIEQLDINGFIARQCHNALFSAPNSLVVVDCPVEQTTQWPEPYLRLVASKSIYRAAPAMGSNELGLLQFAFLNEGENRRALFDDTHISIYERTAGTNAKEVEGWVMVSSEPHNLPFCPAFKMWADVEQSNMLVSHSMIRACLALLDEYVLNSGAKRSNDLKAAYAYFWHWQEELGECDYSYHAHGAEFPCLEGWIEVPGFDNAGQIVAEITPTKFACPACLRRKKAKKRGPGSSFPLPAPTSKEEFDLREPAGWIKAPLDSLTYVRDEVIALEAKILKQATGHEGGPINKSALNEDQISALIESARQVGEYLAEYYELLHKRILDAVLTMRYGPYYLGCTVNYGRRFAALSGDLLMVLMERAKKIGSVWLLEVLDDMLQDYHARGDSSKGLRFRILNDLSTYRFMSPSDMVGGGLDTANREGYLTTSGLLYYVARFEREEGSAVEVFGSTIEYNKLVETIIEKINGYIGELPEPIQAQPGSAEGPTNKGGRNNKPGPTTPTGSGK